MKLTFEQKSWIQQYEYARSQGRTFNGDSQEWIMFEDIPVPEWYEDYLLFLEDEKEPKKQDIPMNENMERFLRKELPSVTTREPVDDEPLVVIEAQKYTNEINQYLSELGKKGGKKRAEKLTKEQRSAIARLGGLAKGRKSNS